MNARNASAFAAGEPGRDVVVGEGLVLRYACDPAALGPALARRFVPLAYDRETASFVREAFARPHGRLRGVSYALLRRVLSDYDAYGLLGMYPMHVCSAAQFQALLGTRRPGAGRSLLDVGAGSGQVTALAAAGFDHVLAIETSAVMRARLRRRGIRVLLHDLERAALPSEHRADVVLCLNVLDRTARPRSLLEHLRGALLPAGTLLLSVPLPLRPHVQHRGYTSDPDELLPAPDSATWEAAAAALVRELLEPAGLQVRTLSRAPYLSRGDAGCPLYALDAALFVCGG